MLSVPSRPLLSPPGALEVAPSVSPIRPPFWALTLGQAGYPHLSRGLDRVLHTPAPFLTPALHPPPPHRRQLGLGAFPVESRWQGVYGPFRDFLRAGCPGDLQEALLGFHVQSSRELRKSQEYLCCER